MSWGTTTRATSSPTAPEGASGAAAPAWTLTQTWPCAIVTPCGASPTSIVASTRFASGSTRETVPPRLFATHTAPPPAAIPVGLAPTRIVWVTAAVSVSMRETVSSCVSATQTAPSPTAIADGP